MAKFRYVAVGPEGARQAGTITAPSMISARYELVARQFKVRTLRERKSFSKIEITKKKVKAQDIANLSRQLAAFLRAGISILDAMDAIAEETTNEVMRQMLIEMADQLRGGDTFADAIALHDEHFPTYYPGIVRSAELSGQLDDVLDQLASYIDRDQATRRKVKSAMTYPMVLGVMAVVTCSILIGYVLPKFKDFFAGFDAQLPTTTKLMLGLGSFMGDYGPMVFGAGFLLLAVLFLLLRTERGRLFRNKTSLRTPVLRDVVSASVIERFCRILSAMVSAGIPIADSMRAAIDSTDNRVFSKKLVTASERMLRGEGLGEPLAQTEMFPGMVTQMMRVGEETGTLDHQLEIVADFYEQELTFKLERLTQMFEPMMTIFMGLIVGFVAVALVQAMYGIYNSSNLGG